MRNSAVFICCWIICIFCSCEKKYEYSIDEGNDNRYVLNVLFTQDSICYGRISKTLDKTGKNVEIDPSIVKSFGLYLLTIKVADFKDTMINGRLYFKAENIFVPNFPYSVKVELEDIVIEGMDFLPFEPMITEQKLTYINDEITQLSLRFANTELYQNIRIRVFNPVDTQHYISFYYELKKDNFNYEFKNFVAEAHFNNAVGWSIDDSTNVLIKLPFLAEEVKLEVSSLSPSYFYNYYNENKNVGFADELDWEVAKSQSNVTGALGMIGGLNTKIIKMKK